VTEMLLRNCYRLFSWDAKSCLEVKRVCYSTLAIPSAK